MKKFPMIVQLLAVTLIVVFGSASATLAGDDADFEKFSKKAVAKKKETISRLLAKRAPSIVTLRFVAKESFMGQQQKTEMEAPAVMVSPDGLVLAPNSKLGGLMGAVFAQVGGMGGIMDNLPKPTVDTEDFRVIVGNESEEYDAKLIARDSDLDLAWVRIEDAKGRTFSHMEFTGAVDLEVGDTYYTINRMAERFDRVPMVTSATVSASVENPRPLLVSTSPAVGPVFSGEGQVVGFMITQPPEEGEETTLSTDFATLAYTFILPGARVAKSLEEAVKIAKQQQTE